MDLVEVRNLAREKFRGVCRVCPQCNGVACSGEVPGMGGIGSGASFRNNVNALAGFKLNLTAVHDVNQPKMNCRILSMDLALPIIGAPFGGAGVNLKNAVTEKDFQSAVITGCRQAGTIGMFGDGPVPSIFNAGLHATRSHDGWGIPTIKPREIPKIVEMVKKVADVGVPAFAMDIDAAGHLIATFTGNRVGPKTPEDLAEIKRLTPIPFIVKGIMTVRDAEACCAAGVDAIVVSHHGGRALDHLPGTAEVLPSIAAAVKKRMTILVDGGIRSGVDVLKMLALGADAVLIGRPLFIAAVGGQAEGVELLMKSLAGQLQSAMVLTGTADVSSVDPLIIWGNQEQNVRNPISHGTFA